MCPSNSSDQFKDHFSTASDAYARYRPQYPSAMFAYLASISPDRTLAWDCATGTGQAARALATHFHEVVATDASEAQIAQAEPHSGVRYEVCLAENSPLETGSVSLVTVAQALHWFDVDRFYQEVRRVLKPDGVFAVWTYNLHRIDPTIDAIVYHLYEAIVGSYWPPERRLIENNYADIPFPFERVNVPAFDMSLEWRLADLLGYLSTWSAVRHYRADQGVDPLSLVSHSLDEAWGDANLSRTVRWPLTLMVGRTS